MKDHEMIKPDHFWPRFLILFLPLFVLASAGAWFIAHSEKQTRQRLFYQQEHDRIKNQRHSIVDALKVVRSDLLYLTKDSTFLEAQPGLTDKQRDSRARKYQVFAFSRKNYHQICFFDQLGIERIRVDYNGGSPVSVVAEQLAAAVAQPSYIAAALALDRGEISMSPFNLFSRNGKIAEPVRPILRFATPVFNQQGTRLGVLALKLSGMAILAHLAPTHEDDPERHSLLVTRAGQWLQGPEGKDDSAFISGSENSNSFATDFPAEWAIISGNQAGAHTSINGLFLFDTIYPGQEISVVNQELSGVGGLADQFPGGGEYYWKIVSRIPAENFANIPSPFKHRLWAGYLAACFIIGIMAFYLATLLTKRRLAERALMLANQEWQISIDALDAFICVLDLNGVIRKANKAMRARFEPSFGPVIGQDYRRLYCTSPTAPPSLCASPGDGEIVKVELDNLSLPGWQLVSSYPLLGRGDGQLAAVLVVEDITERKMAEIELRISKELWEKTFDALPDLIMVLDTEFNIVRANLAIRRRIGLGEREYLGLKCYSVLHACGVPCPDCPYQTALQDQKNHEVDFFDEQLGGHFLFSASPMFTEDGELLGCINVAKDITTIKAAENQIKNSHQFLQAVINGISDPIMVIDSNYEVLLLNIAAQEAGSYEENSPERLTCHQVSHGQEYPCGGDEHPCPMRLVAEGGQAATVIHRHLNRDREMEAYYEIVASPIYDAKGVLQSVVEVSRDITDRVNAERVLRKSEESFRTMAENLPGIVYRLWLHDHPEQPMHFFNEMVLPVTGYKPEELGKGSVCEFEELILPKDRSLVLETLKRSIMTNLPFEVEYRLRRKDGAIVNIAEIGRPVLDEEGLVSHIDGFIIDVTDRKKVEERLLLYAGTQKVLLREVNHRVKNNLTAIISMLHHEEDRAEYEGAGEIVQRLREVVGRVEGLLVVHSLLSAVEWQALSLSRLCRELVEEALKGLPVAKSVELEVEEADVLVDADQAHYLAIILNELAINSLKYAFQGRTMIRIRISVKCQAGSVVLVFSDDGPGYPESILRGEFPKDSIGTSLMVGIARGSLAGTIEFAHLAGATTIITFPQHNPLMEKRGNRDD